ncbi:MAG: sarcosine oxidase subunit delta [Caulobacteraceae bacterium]
MRIPCPFCGERDSHEFVSRGEAAPPRPDPAGPGAEGQFFEYLYLRDNPAGPNREHWYHAAGCRQWLLVERDTRTHAILGVSLTKDGA